jgi:hypothetical protein
MSERCHEQTSPIGSLLRLRVLLSGAVLGTVVNIEKWSGSSTYTQRLVVRRNEGCKMTEKLPLTIEILGLEDGHPVVLDRVIGGSIYLEEAKRIGHHLLSLVDAGTHPAGYCVLTDNHKLVYAWRADDGTSHEKTQS